MTDLAADVDSFQALARSAPWRFTGLHFRHRSELSPGVVEAWLRRPGELATIGRTGDRRVIHGSRSPHPFVPTMRPDGLVAERPSRRDYDYDDPMLDSYQWVAMLDP